MRLGRVKRPADAPKGASCWECHYKINKQSLLHGVCNYFKNIGQEPKEIPPDMVDKGCKFFADKNKEHPIIRHTMELFDGEYLPEKKKYVHKKSTYKRKFKDTRHKYGKRADWD